MYLFKILVLCYQDHSFKKVELFLIISDGNVCQTLEFIGIKSLKSICAPSIKRTSEQSYSRVDQFLNFASNIKQI